MRIDLIKEDAKQSLNGVQLDSLEGKSILVTGASGLVGTHLLYGLNHCRDLGVRVKVSATVNRQIPEHLFLLSEWVEIVHGDLTKPCVIDRIRNYDFVIHAACSSQPQVFMERPLETIMLNTYSTAALLGKLKDGGRGLFLSTSEVYSGLENPPFIESQIGTTTPSHSRACYIESKRCGEAICHSYRNNGANVSSARLCLAYGPGAAKDDKRVVFSLIEKALETGAVNLLDNGLAKRSYCYISDAVNMLWKILTEGTSAVYNVGGDSETTILQMAQSIGSTLSVPVTAVSSGSVAGAPSNVRVSTDLYRSQFENKLIGMDEGLQRTIQWHKGLRE